MTKNADAFRTISEVAEDLDLPQHVLRFWETRFPQIKPLKRAGGRRFYRPGDVELIAMIRRLLYDEGYTIKGVQRVLKEQGIRVLQAGVRAAVDGGSAPRLFVSRDGGVTEADALEARDPDGLEPDAIERNIEDDHVVVATQDVTSGQNSAFESAEPLLRGEDRAILLSALSVITACEAILRSARY